jgi:gamma-glutamyltranspeptidase/glutathione hydrolase
MHLRIEAMKHAFADRARWLGDADFAPVPVEYLTSDAYARQLAQQITLTGTATPADYGRQQLPDDRGTAHFCVADAAGNVVALTETINGTWGSHVVVEPFGIILNNELDDFLTVRGQPNLYGLVQGEANLIAPGKRPLSSMSPTIVLRDDQPVLALGASGGPRIISSVLNVMLNIIDVGQPLAPAIASVRVHHQWQPDEVVFDRDPSDAGAAGLRARGHRLADARRSGIVQAIRFRPDGTLVGASDPRKGGRPAGVD